MSQSERPPFLGSVSRGAIRAARGDVAGAVADLERALQLAADNGYVAEEGIAAELAANSVPEPEADLLALLRRARPRCIRGTTARTTRRRVHARGRRHRERCGSGDGGEGGIRTHGRLAPSPDFESGPFNRTPAPLREGRGI